MESLQGIADYTHGQGYSIIFFEERGGLACRLHFDTRGERPRVRTWVKEKREDGIYVGGEEITWEEGDTESQVVDMAFDRAESYERGNLPFKMYKVEERLPLYGPVLE